MRTASRMTILCLLGLILASGCGTVRQYELRVKAEAPLSIEQYQADMVRQCDAGLIPKHISVTDRGAQDSANGYIEIYAASNSTENAILHVTRVKESGADAWGEGAFWDDRRIRIVCPAGTHAVLVSPLNWVSKSLYPAPVMDWWATSALTNTNWCVQVKVERGRVTPVRASVKEVTPDADKRKMEEVKGPVVPATRLAGECPIGDVTFLIAAVHARQLHDGTALIRRAAKDLDLTSESGRAAFLDRYRKEREQAPDLKYMLVTCPSIAGL